MSRKYYYILIVFICLIFSSCNFVSHRTYIKTEIAEGEDPEPDYNISLDNDYQNFVEFMFMGNRSESFGTYFNKFFTAIEDYDAAMLEYNASFIANFNPKLDSLNILPSVQQSIKDKFTKVIERCSKIIQYNKNTRYIDDAVLLIGKSYYYMQDYLQAERKFNEFLSKLTASPLYDEAILYLARTKMKLNKFSEAEIIFKNLLEKTKDNEIKSEIFEELAIYSLTKRDYNNAIVFFQNSIDETKVKEKKAKKQFIIGKIYMKSDPEKAIRMYDNVVKNTSDFDLEFYALLNKAVALNITGKSSEALILLTKLERQYRDYPELKQLASGEYVNTLFLLKKYNEAILKSFEVIYSYQSTKVAADCYYYIGNYYENIKGDYFNAAINYKKARNTSTVSDYYYISESKYNTLNKYFTYLAEINDTTKTEIPDENPDFFQYNLDKAKEKGEEQPGKQPQQEENKGKTGAVKNFFDSIKVDNSEIPIDTVEKNNSDTVKTENKKDSIKLNPIQNDSTDIQPKNESPPINQDSILQLKKDKIFTAYFSMAELFIYNFNIIDSAIYYMKYVVDNDNDIKRKPKAMYMLATLYKSKGWATASDSLLNSLIEIYPETELANESRKLLGLPVVELSKDEADIEYIDAMQKAVTGNYNGALAILKNIPNKYPLSHLVPKAIYATAYVYEYYILNKDSAYVYYKLLKDKYPGSPYSVNLDEKIEIFAPESEKKKKLNSDSTIVKDTTKINLKDSLLNGENIPVISDSTKLPDLPIIPTDSSAFKKEETESGEN